MIQRLRVAMVAPPWITVPPVGYGGIELIVHLLHEGLRRQGADVTLYARAGSASAVAMAPAAYLDDLGRFHHQFARETAYTARIIRHLREHPVDVIHDHAGLLSLSALSAARLAPVVHTAHGPLDEQHIDAYSEVAQDVSLVAISNAQAASAPSVGWRAVVANAVDESTLRIGNADERAPYVLCLARISVQKGQHLAIEACRAAGRPLILAGKAGETDEDQEYYHSQIVPHLDGVNVRHIQNVWGDEKRELLARAFALLHPVQWPEPFGLAMLEAMLSGTPVVGIGLGAVPELVTHGETGYVASDASQLASWLDACGAIDRHRCAASARARFSSSRMVSEYLQVYGDAVTQRSASRETQATATV